MSALTSSLCRQAARTLRPRPALASSVRAFRPIAVQAARPSVVSRIASASFSTSMPTLSANAAAVPAGKNEFDPEVVDIASYVHNVKIDSDLAVSTSWLKPASTYL